MSAFAHMAQVLSLREPKRRTYVVVQGGVVKYNGHDGTFASRLFGRIAQRKPRTRVELRSNDVVARHYEPKGKT